MKKDIEIPIAEEVYVAAVNEWDEKHLSKTWYIYLINNRESAIEGAILVSKGYGEALKTTTMRHGLGDLEAKSFRKVELIQEEVFKLKNEFFLTFFADNKLYEKKFLFNEYQISESNEVAVPVLGIAGVLAN
ncbi:hypothetical protein JoomaDRAFT_1030 [Galbibacter orientalis DSM 19592]|uniref:Phenylalanyl-tRNA synthetase subunit alpha n=1 Tax=Galbibacter orientalis DSM 19592 TaxID=926559 RepID=I3C358_9FLAO|nr:hypothetical protein [Galbibacter orientalis]EIJ38051.1 hypothetical protein JoomaDRAFT_1030 [Galbibacter orientalis DSM 19592]